MGRNLPGRETSLVGIVAFPDYAGKVSLGNKVSFGNRHSVIARSLGPGSPAHSHRPAARDPAAKAAGTQARAVPDFYHRLSAGGPRHDRTGLSRRSSNFAGRDKLLPKSSAEAHNRVVLNSFAGECGRNPTAEGATGPRKRSGKRTAKEQNTLESWPPLQATPTE
jgi:hypothetical protein